MANNTVVSPLILVPGWETISVYSPFTGDDNEDAQTILEYRQAGGTWKRVFPLVQDKRAQVSLANYQTGATEWIDNPFKDQWRGIIFWLQPDTNYEVRVIYSDPDGVTGSPVSAIVRTLSYNPPSTGTTYYVSNTGNDGNDGLTPATAFATLVKANNVAQPGDIFLFMPGTYAGMPRDSIMNSGLPNNYIIYESYDQSDRAKITNRLWFGGGGYIRLINLDFLPGTEQNISFWAAHHIMIETCSFTVMDSEDWTAGGPTAAIVFNDASHHILVKDSQITSSAIRLDRHSIFSNGTDNYALFIKHNSIISTGLKDGMGGHWYKDCIISENYVEGPWDDPIEAEGKDCNCAVWGNTVKNGYMGIGLATVTVGPMYIFRNVIAGASDAVIKVGNSSQAITFFFHNTLYVNTGFTGIGAYGNNDLVNNLIMRNNNIVVGGYVIEASNPDPAWNAWDLDYDNLLSLRSGRRYKWRVGVDNAQNTFEEFRTALLASPLARGYEEHGMSVNPMFVDPANGDLRLQAASPCIDKGIILHGFNDSNSPWPYRGAAPDLGAIEYGTTPPPPPPPPPPPVSEQTISLVPGESKVVSFEAIPHEAGVYSVTVDGLHGSFRAL